MAEKSLLPDKEKDVILELERLIGKSIPIIRSGEHVSFGIKVSKDRIIKLGLCEANLKKIPKSIKNLIKLRELDLRNNNLHTLPIEIFEIETLKKLYMVGNHINKLEGSIEITKKIATIEIDDPKVKSSINLRYKFKIVKDFYTSPVPHSFDELSSILSKIPLKYPKYPETFFVAFLDNITEEENFNSISDGKKEFIFRDIDFEKIYEHDWDGYLKENLIKIVSKPHLQIYDKVKEIEQMYVDNAIYNKYYESRCTLIGDLIRNGGKYIQSLLKKQFLKEIKEDILEQKESKFPLFETTISFIISYEYLFLFDKEELADLDLKELYYQYTAYYDSERKLPKEIEYITSLEKIHIYQESDKPFHLPNSLKNLTNLREIILEGIDFSEFFPEIIFELKNLEKLEISISHSRFNKVPERIGELTQLKELKMTYNNLKTLPESFSNLQNLEILDLANNEFEKIPNPIISLGALKSLNLAANPVGNSPRIQELKQRLNKLQDLDLSATFLRELPIWITRLDSLKSLRLFNNSLKTIPKEIENLRSLEELDLKRNKLKFLEETIGNLESLRKLNLEINKLESIPESICGLNNLKYLNLNSNLLKELPKNIGRLNSLKKIEIKNNKLIFLPSSIKNLKNIDYIALEGNYFKDVPKYVSSIKKIPERFIGKIDMDLHRKNIVQQIKNTIKTKKKEEILSLFEQKLFALLNNSDIIELCYDPDTDLLRLLINMHEKEDFWNRDKKIYYPKNLFQSISFELSEKIVEIIENNDLEDLEVLIQLRLDDYLNKDHLINLLSDEGKIKLIKAVYENEYIMERNQERFKNNVGISLSNGLKKHIKKRFNDVMFRENSYLEKEDGEIVFFFYYDWFELLSENDLHELLNDKDLHFLERIIKYFDDSYFDYGFSRDRLFFVHIKTIIPPKEAEALSDLDKNIEKAFVFAVNFPEYRLCESHPPVVEIRNNEVLGLNLDYNEIDQLPSSIKNFSKLEYLSCCDCNLKSLPDSIGNLKKLTHLNISYNELRKLPLSIGNLKKLTHLNIIENNLTELPHTIWSLKSLKTIDSGFFDTPGLEKTALSKLYKFYAQKNSLDSNKKMPSLKEVLKIYLNRYQLSGYVDEIFNLVKFRIRIDLKNMKVSDAFNEPKISKFGGHPDVPADFEWPNYKGKPLNFLGQINLSDIKDFSCNRIPKKAGLLSFFYDKSSQPSFNSEGNLRGWRVFYLSEQDLERKLDPNQSPSSRPNTGEIIFFRDLSLPTPWSMDLTSIQNNYENKRNYQSFFNDLFELDFQKTSHWMFGYPFELEGPGMDVKAHIGSFNLDLDEIEKSIKLDKWFHLLMLSPDYRLEWNWVREGRIYFWINKKDINENSYEKIRLIREYNKDPLRGERYILAKFKNMQQVAKEYNEIPFENLSMTRFQIRTFLNELAGEDACQYRGIEWKCAKNHDFSYKILDKLTIPKNDQVRFLELCKEYGGYCDCEILMNAARHLLDEETPW